MADKLSMCNMALNYLGSAPLSSLDVDSSQDSASKKSIRLCNLFFDQARDESLVRYRWRCARTRAVLAEDGSTPGFEQWDHQYHLPSDPWCLRVLQMEYKDQAFSVEGRLLLTNEGKAKILYVKRIVNFGELHPYAVEVIAHILAIKMAIALRGENGVQIKEQLATYLKTEILPEAKSTNALEGMESDFQKVHETEWVRARRGGSRDYLRRVSNG